METLSLKKKHERFRNETQGSARANSKGVSELAPDTLRQNPPLGHSERPSGYPTDGRLHRACPDPLAGVSPLAKSQVHRLTDLICKQLKELNPGLAHGYWREVTREILRASGPGIQVIPARAGSGKSTWIRAFLLVLCKLWVEKDPLAEALGGVLLVVQKVEDLNEIVDLLQQTYPGADSSMAVALQSLTKSGRDRGLCLNPDVKDYVDCDKRTCLYASDCPLITINEEGPRAFLLGVTQARFYAMRRDGCLDELLYRIRRPEQSPIPRRFILFDEKPELYQICALDLERINQASSSLEKLVQQRKLADHQACALQTGLSIHIKAPFQAVRKEMGTDRVEVDFCSLNGMTEQRAGYLDFRSRLLQRPDLMSGPLRDCIEVLDQAYGDAPVLCCTTGGFHMFGLRDGMAELTNSQVMIFDATAEIDADYRNSPGLQFLKSTPALHTNQIIFHIFENRSLNVSRKAFQKSWLKEGLADLVLELLPQYPGQTFLCTYQPFGEYFARQLEHAKHVIPFMEGKEPHTVPYFGGTNGSNDFNACSNVILLGYPRLSPSTYLARTYAVWPEEVRRELEKINKKDTLRSLPILTEYESCHLTARLEQEIYRCSLRNPKCEDQIHIFLFYPPERVLALLLQRFPGCRLQRQRELPACIEKHRGEIRKYHGAPTAYAKLKQFLDTWDGSPIRTTELRKRLEISTSAWKELRKQEKTRTLLSTYGIVQSGRGANTILSISPKNEEIPA